MRISPFIYLGRSHVLVVRVLIVLLASHFYKTTDRVYLTDGFQIFRCLADACPYPYASLEQLRSTVDAAVPVVSLEISAIGEVGTVVAAGLAYEPFAQGGESNEMLRLLVLSLVVLSQLRGIVVAGAADVAVGNLNRKCLSL